MSLQEQFEIRAFGPCRVIGMNSKGKPQDNQIPQLWASVCARVRETELEEPGFGVCRCVPEARDGSFEYVAAFSARENAKIPAGMMAIEIPRSDYAVLAVPGIPEVGNRGQPRLILMRRCNGTDIDAGPKVAHA